CAVESPAGEQFHGGGLDGPPRIQKLTIPEPAGWGGPARGDTCVAWFHAFTVADPRSLILRTSKGGSRAHATGSDSLASD
ncbi:hypothetical protein, partial [Frankia canadensis]|uniref:hypothetical protein n=1 Tax=Frankia canadensis TaxID=1836972 RepID=UPI001A9C80EA